MRPYVIIRTIGERTLPLCLYSLQRNNINRSNISIINNNRSSFYFVLEKSFKKAILLNHSHVLILDADLILVSDAFNKIERAIDLYGNYFRIEFKKICKFTTKQHGIHLYNVARLKNEGIQYLHSCKDTLNPESFIIKMLFNNGHNLVQYSGGFFGLA